MSLFAKRQFLALQDRPLFAFPRFQRRLRSTRDSELHLSSTSRCLSTNEFIASSPPLHPFELEAKAKSPFKKPKAANPVSFQRNFFDTEGYHHEISAQKNRTQEVKRTQKVKPRPSGLKKWVVSLTESSSSNESKKNTGRPVRRYISRRSGADVTKRKKEPSPQTVAELLKSAGEQGLPNSTWVRFEGVSPTSSLESILHGVRDALEAEQQRGIIDLESSWVAGQQIPFLKIEPEQDVIAKWVRKARLILSPYARPFGWYLYFADRSAVYALLKYASETPIRCAWKEVKTSAYNYSTDPTERVENPNYFFNSHVGDHTLRLENIPSSCTASSLISFFSRFDLQSKNPISKWVGVTSDGRKAPATWLIHFADAAWARAALREKQASFMYNHGKKYSDTGTPIRLIHYPKQML